MKNQGPIYAVLATMAIAAMAIGGEPVRHNSKQIELSKSEARKSGYEVVAKDFEAQLSTEVAVAIATVRARKRTG